MQLLFQGISNKGSSATSTENQIKRAIMSSGRRDEFGTEAPSRQTTTTTTTTTTTNTSSPSPPSSSCSTPQRPFSCYRPRRLSGQEAMENGAMRYCIPQYPKESLDVMKMMRNNQSLCDVKLVVGNEIFYAHKLVLAAASPYFKAMFTSGLKECEMSSVTLQGVCPKIMRMLLCFVYTSEIVVTESNVCHLLPAATMYQISHVVDACTAYLEKEIDPTNAIGIAKFAQQHGCMDLFRKTNEFIYRHFSLVCVQEEFLQLERCQLVALIKCDELNVKCEKEVYNAVLKWVKYDETNRQRMMEDILAAVRCHFLTPDFLKDQIKNCDLVRRSQHCRDYLKGIFQDLTLHKKPCVKQRTPTAPGVIYVAGGYLRHSLGCVECFNVQEQKWTALMDLPLPRSGLGGAFIQGVFYVVGGRNNSPEGNVDSNAIDRYDPVANVWLPCAHMNVARSRAGVGVMDSRLYAVGGAESANIHNSVERYNPDENKWEMMAPMSVKRIGVGVAVVNRLLYAVGGFDGLTRLSNVECYHPENNEWLMVAPMKTSRSASGVLALEHFVYAVGGYDGTQQLKTVERYNSETNEWQFVAPLKAARSALSVAALNGKLYALGGYDGTNFLSSVEVYDPCLDRWEDAPSMNYARSGHVAAVWTASCKVHCDVFHQ